MAPRLRPTCEDRQPVVVAGLVALALLGLGEAAPGAFPIRVSIEGHAIAPETSVEGHATALEISVDGQSHTVPSTLGGNFRAVVFEQPGPLEREYQVDGSDTTSTNDLQARVVQELQNSPLYQFDAWLRDESSYSRWEHTRLVDLATGQTVPSNSVLPAEFRIEADLRRPEAAAQIWLVGASSDSREGLELDRDRRNARWLIRRDGATEALPRWFFPEQPAPFAAELLHLLGRSAAAGYALVLATLGVARIRIKVPRPDGEANLRIVGDVLLGGWLIAAALVTSVLYHQLPHVLDAVAYTFQAGLFASGQLALPAPPVAAAFRGPFEVMWQGRVFSQYPPGAPAAYALGLLFNLEWLVGPLACLALVGLTSWTAGALFGRACGAVVLALGVLSPFVLFQAGSFLSHPIAAGLLAGALAAFVAGERDQRDRWYAVSATLLGAAFVTREAASLLFALPLGLRLVASGHWRQLARMVAFGLPFVVVYLLYNQQLTGSPWLLPRALFDSSDRFGFGDGIGFHHRHTLAAGLVNTDELLTLLQLDVLGWPPLFALGLIGLPFLLGRAQTWDVLAAAGFLAFVVAYAAYFYHGIALGPRYYFEAMPWLLLLAGRGAHTLGQLAHSRGASLVVLGVLSLNTVLFYLPIEIQRRADMSGLPGASKVRLGFVQPSLRGPRLVGVPSSSLVVTDDWWLFNSSLAALNCPRLPDCPVLFALATTPEHVDALRANYPHLALLMVIEHDGRLDLAPDGNHQ